MPNEERSEEYYSSAKFILASSSVNRYTASSTTRKNHLRATNSLRPRTVLTRVARPQHVSNEFVYNERKQALETRNVCLFGVNSARRACLLPARSKIFYTE